MTYRALALAALPAACAPGRAPARPAAPATVTVSGDLAIMTVQVDGVPVAMPSAGLTLDPRAPLLDGAPANLRPLWGKPVPFRATVRWPEGAPRAFTLTIREVEPQAAPVRRLTGAGTPPVIRWDGLDDGGQPAPEGALFEAQLAVTGGGGAEAQSPRRRFGLVYGLTPAHRQVVLRGDFFAGEPLAPQATPELGRQVMTVAHALAPLDELSVEVHADGTGDALERLAQTQKQAELVRDLFHAAGVAGERVKARGRGNLKPLAAPDSAEGRAQNQRVVVDVESLNGPPGGRPIAPAEEKVGATVAGRPADVDVSGRFAEEVPRPADGHIAVEIVGADGRRQARVVSVTP